MSKVLTNLYLGEATDANNKKLLDELKITHILIVARELPEFQCNGYEYLKINASDSYTYDIKQHFDEMNKFIETGRNKGAVLVHCMFGVSRSATAVIAYTMFKKKITFKKAIAFVSSKRKIQPNENFIKQLMEFSDELFIETKIANNVEPPIAQNSLNNPFKTGISRTQERENSLTPKKNVSPSPAVTLIKKREDNFTPKRKSDIIQNSINTSRKIEKSIDLKLSRYQSFKKSVLQNQIGSFKVVQNMQKNIDIYSNNYNDRKQKSSSKKVAINQLVLRNQSNSNKVWNLYNPSKEKVDQKTSSYNIQDILKESDKKPVVNYFCIICDTKLFSSTDMNSHSKNNSKEFDKCNFFFLKNLYFFASKKDSCQLVEIKCPTCDYFLGNFRGQGVVCSCGAYVQNGNRIGKKNVKIMVNE